MNRKPLTGNRTGQVAVEGFVTIGIILFLFTALVLMSFSRDNELGVKLGFMDKMDACTALQGAVAAVLASGNGSSYSLEMVSNEPISIQSRYAEVGQTNQYICTLSAEVGSVNLSGGIIQICNEGGTITLQNV